MEQSPIWEVVSRSGGQDISRLLLKWKVHHHCHKSRPLVLVLHRLNSAFHTEIILTFAILSFHVLPCSQVVTSFRIFLIPISVTAYMTYMCIPHLLTNLMSQYVVSIREATCVFSEKLPPLLEVSNRGTSVARDRKQMWGSACDNRCVRGWKILRSQWMLYWV